MIKPITLFGKIIEEVKCVTLLGVTLEYNLTFTKHMEKATNKTGMRLNLMRRIRGTTWGANKDTLLKLYKSYIRPVLEYGHVVTADACANQILKLQVIQNKALRIALRRPYTTKIEDLHAIANMPMIQDRLN